MKLQVQSWTMAKMKLDFNGETTKLICQTLHAACRCMLARTVNQTYTVVRSKETIIVLIINLAAFLSS